MVYASLLPFFIELSQTSSGVIIVTFSTEKFAKVWQGSEKRNN